MYNIVYFNLLFINSEKKKIGKRWAFHCCYGYLVCSKTRFSVKVYLNTDLFIFYISTYACIINKKKKNLEKRTFLVGKKDDSALARTFFWTQNNHRYTF